MAEKQSLQPPQAEANGGDITGEEPDLADNPFSGPVRVLQAVLSSLTEPQEHQKGSSSSDVAASGQLGKQASASGW